MRGGQRLQGALCRCQKRNGSIRPYQHRSFNFYLSKQNKAMLVEEMPLEVYKWQDAIRATTNTTLQKMSQERRPIWYFLQGREGECEVTPLYRCHLLWCATLRYIRHAVGMSSWDTAESRNANWRIYLDAVQDSKPRMFCRTTSENKVYNWLSQVHVIMLHSTWLDLHRCGWWTMKVVCD